MTNDRIAVIDLETTGLSPWRHDRIVEIAIVIISANGEIQLEYETLINPNRDLGASRIHQISAADVLDAPTFADVAGDVLEILKQANVHAGHNVSFDKNFLLKEYERLDGLIPETPLLCTCRLFGRQNLKACCKEFGVEFDGVPHRAIADARATARIVSIVCREDPTLLETHRFRDAIWPTFPARKTPCFRREHAEQALNQPPRFLQRLAERIHHDVDAETPNVLAYMALIDRVLEDRTIDRAEEDTLVDAALNWQLSAAQVKSVHEQYVRNLSMLALADGVVSDSERQDLHVVAKLLGCDDSALDLLLETAAAQLKSAGRPVAATPDETGLRGKKVCFTGELQSTIGGQPITREMAEALATQAGLATANSVTKKLDILVVADPNTQSGKAKKARDYGIRILSDAVFWRMAGIKVD